MAESDVCGNYGFPSIKLTAVNIILVFFNGNYFGSILHD